MSFAQDLKMTNRKSEEVRFQISYWLCSQDPYESLLPSESEGSIQLDPNLVP